MLQRVLLLFSCSLSLSQALPPPLDITLLDASDPQCRRNIDTLRYGLNSNLLWAQEILDAGVRSPVGVFSETAVQFGDFDQCLGVSAPFETQFCLVDISPVAGNYSLWSSIKWGVCVPASCETLDLQTSIQRYMDSSTGHGDAVQALVMGETCTTKDTATAPISIPEIVFCVTVGVLFLIVGCSTVHDMMVDPKYDGSSTPKTVTQCLSLRYGWYSLLRAEPAPNGINLEPLYGLRLLSIFFVIVGHRYGMHLIYMTLTNYKAVQEMFKGSWLAIWVGHMDLFVDTFFFMSAFLLAILYPYALDKSYLNPFSVYLIRFCRLIPAYVAVLLFYSTMLRHLGDGPLWNLYMIPEQENCRRYWWTNVLFMNNYIERDHICLPQSWYLSCEFQLFLAGTLVVLLLHKHYHVGVALSLVLLLASSAITFFGTYLYDRPAIMVFNKAFWTNTRQNDMFRTVYTQAHYRGTSYIPGLLSGIYVYRRKVKLLSKTSTYIIHATGCFVFLAVYWSGSIFYNESVTYNQLVVSLYAAVFHSLFGVALSLLAISWTLGFSTPLSNFFSWKGFIALGKLTYCVYLVHFIWPFVWLASSRTPVYLTVMELISWSIADFALSLVTAFVIYLTIESPFRYLIKRLITQDKPTTEPAPKQSLSVET